MTSRHGWAWAFGAAVAIAAMGCSDRGTSGGHDSGGSADAGGGSDGGHASDGGPGTDAGPAHDSGPAHDAGPTHDSGDVRDGGGPIDTGPPRGDSGPGDGGCTPVTCPPLPPGCIYVGGTPCDCGTVECTMPGGCAPACGAAEYCEYPTGDCGATGSGGMCSPRPDLCTDVYSPVCGCDGMTYSNACYAAAAGQNVATDGECPMPADCRTTGCPPRETCMPCRGAGYVCLPSGVVC